MTQPTMLMLFHQHQPMPTWEVPRIWISLSKNWWIIWWVRSCIFVGWEMLERKIFALAAKASHFDRLFCVEDGVALHPTLGWSHQACHDCAPTSSPSALVYVITGGGSPWLVRRPSFSLSKNYSGKLIQPLCVCGGSCLWLITSNVSSSPGMMALVLHLVDLLALKWLCLHVNF